MVRGHDIVPKYGKRVTDVLKGMLRPAIIPAEGHAFVVADWNAIEARVLPWLTDDRLAEDTLTAFREGQDIYKREAANIYRTTPDAVTDEQRQIGKVAILSLGFAGGIGAFAAMGRGYGILMSESDAQRIVNAWRRANPWALRYWQLLENAYMRAMRNPGHEFSAGRVTYLYDKLHLWYMLPSGRVLNYPFARLEEDGVSYLKAAWKPAADATEWPRARLWRGLACENITQATANDLLRESLRELDRRGLSTVLHVHDEIVLECPEDAADATVATLRSVMCTAPAWAEGFPLKADVKVMKRYGK
jgi:DNA polymerase